MSGRKKMFPCGHKGFGQFCHRCVEDQRIAERKVDEDNSGTRKKELDLLSGALHEYREEIGKLPNRSLRGKAVKAIQRLVLGKESYRRFLGKRMEYDRRIISIPIGRDWRMVLEEQQDKSKKLSGVFSHEDYNVRKPG